MFNTPTRKGFSEIPRVMWNKYKEKMSAPNNAYYVLTQAHAGLPNSVLTTALPTDLIPDITNSYDLGTAALLWRNCYFAGTGYFGAGVNIPNDQTYKFGGDDFMKYWEVNKAFGIGKSAGSDTLSSGAVGYYAGYENTGTHQIVMGANAGRNNEGFSQVGMGNRAGYRNTGDNQVAIGYYAGELNTGDNQTVVGNNAGLRNIGEGQTAVGVIAGRDNEGIHQIAVGYYAGNLNTGIYQTAVGYNAGRNNTGNNVVAIGYGAGKDNTVANQFIVQQANINVIPLIQGNFLTGNVGIGTTTPDDKLQVVGDAKFGEDATNYAEFKTDGELNLYGTARVKRHYLIDPSRFKMPAANFPGESFEGIFYTLDFDEGVEESAYCQEHIPFRWASGTDIEVVVDWMHTGADAGAVVWGLEYKSITTGETFAPPTVTITQTTAVGTANNVLLRTTFTSKILAANLAEDDVIAFRFYRKAADIADTLAEDARVVNVHFHFIQDKLGQAT